MTAPIGAMEIIHHSVRAARIGRGVVPDSAKRMAYRPIQGLERDQGWPPGAAVRSSTTVKTGESVRSLIVKMGSRCSVSLRVLASS